MAFTSQTPNLLLKPDPNPLRSFIQKMKQQHLSVPKAEEETFCYIAPENLQSLKTQTGMTEPNKERAPLSCGTFQSGWVLSTTSETLQSSSLQPQLESSRTAGR